MDKREKNGILKKFSHSIKHSNLTENISIAYKIAGGIPEYRKVEEFILSGDGNARVISQDLKKSQSLKKIETKIDPSGTKKLFMEVIPHLKNLMLRSEAKFLPDSLIGSVTIQIGDEKQKYYFMTDSKDQNHEYYKIKDQMINAINLVSEITARKLNKKKGGTK